MLRNNALYGDYGSRGGKGGGAKRKKSSALIFLDDKAHHVHDEDGEEDGKYVTILRDVGIMKNMLKRLQKLNNQVFLPSIRDTNLWMVKYATAILICSKVRSQFVLWKNSLIEEQIFRKDTYEQIREERSHDLRERAYEQIREKGAKSTKFKYFGSSGSFHAQPASSNRGHASFPARADCPHPNAAPDQHPMHPNVFPDYPKMHQNTRLELQTYPTRLDHQNVGYDASHPNRSDWPRYGFHHQNESPRSPEHICQRPSRTTSTDLNRPRFSSDHSINPRTASPYPSIARTTRYAGTRDHPITTTNRPRPQQSDHSIRPRYPASPYRNPLDQRSMHQNVSLGHSSSEHSNGRSRASQPPTSDIKQPASQVYPITRYPAGRGSSINSSDRSRHQPPIIHPSDRPPDHRDHRPTSPASDHFHRTTVYSGHLQSPTTVKSSPDTFSGQFSGNYSDQPVITPSTPQAVAPSRQLELSSEILRTIELVIDQELDKIKDAFRSRYAFHGQSPSPCQQSAPLDPITLVEPPREVNNNPEPLLEQSTNEALQDQVPPLPSVTISTKPSPSSTTTRCEDTEDLPLEPLTLGSFLEQVIPTLGSNAITKDQQDSIEPILEAKEWSCATDSETWELDFPKLTLEHTIPTVVSLLDLNILNPKTSMSYLSIAKLVNHAVGRKEIASKEYDSRIDHSSHVLDAKALLLRIDSTSVPHDFAFDSSLFWEFDALDSSLCAKTTRSGHEASTISLLIQDMMPLNCVSLCRNYHEASWINNRPLIPWNDVHKYLKICMEAELPLKPRPQPPGQGELTLTRSIMRVPTTDHSSLRRSLTLPWWDGEETSPNDLVIASCPRPIAKPPWNNEVSSLRRDLIPELHRDLSQMDEPFFTLSLVILNLKHDPYYDDLRLRLVEPCLELLCFDLDVDLFLGPKNGMMKHYAIRLWIDAETNLESLLHSHGLRAPRICKEDSLSRPRPAPPWTITTEAVSFNPSCGMTRVMIHTAKPTLSLSLVNWNSFQDRYCIDIGFELLNSCVELHALIHVLITCVGHKTNLARHYAMWPWVDDNHFEELKEFFHGLMRLTPIRSTRRPRLKPSHRGVCWLAKGTHVAEECCSLYLRHEAFTAHEDFPLVKPRSNITKKIKAECLNFNLLNGLIHDITHTAKPFFPPFLVNSYLNYDLDFMIDLGIRMKHCFVWEPGITLLKALYDYGSLVLCVETNPYALSHEKTDLRTNPFQLGGDDIRVGSLTFGVSRASLDVLDPRLAHGLDALMKNILGRLEGHLQPMELKGVHSSHHSPKTQAMDLYLHLKKEEEPITCYFLILASSV